MKNPRFQGFRETPFVFLEKDDERWHKQLKPYYGVDDSFPYQNLFGRSVESETRRNLYLVNSAIKNILINNTDTTLKMINAGIRMFGRNESKLEESAFRLVQEGVHILKPFMNKRYIECEQCDAISILTSTKGCKFVDMSQSTQALLAEQPDGSILLHCLTQDGHVTLCTWKGKVTLTPYISKGAKLHLLRLLHQDTSKFEEEMISSRKRKAVRTPEHDGTPENGETPENEESMSEENSKIEDLGKDFVEKKDIDTTENLKE